MNYIIQNKKNIESLCIVSLLLFLFIFPNITLADNLYGQTCGNTTCRQDEVCQKQYRGVLPIGSQNTGSATYTCVKPQAIEAPASPYKGIEGCAPNTSSGSGLFGSITGGLGSGFNGIIGSTLNSTLNNVTGNFLGNLVSPFGVDLSGTITGALQDPIGQFTGNFTDLVGLDNLLAECNYNNINGVIDTRRLIAPLPVDLFNPLPLPVNVTSPTPLPVVVVDDLALYQQKELIDAPLAAQQKAKTIATVSDTFRYEISSRNLIPDNYFAIQSLGIQFGALDPETGVIAKDAIETYGNYANFSLDKNNELTQYFKNLQDPTKSQLPKETFTEKCGNIKVEEATTLECQLLGMQTNNNANDISVNIAYDAQRKSTLAGELLDKELRDGNGYFAKSDGENLFTKKIQTPGNNVASLSEKVAEATIDQAIVASGDNCFEAIPKNILDGTLKPVLTQGLYGVNNTLASVLNNVKSDPINSLQNPQNFANQLQAGVTGAIPDPNRFFRSLQDSLVQNVTSGLSCELNKQISGLLNGIIGNVTLPGIGNVSGAITNAATGVVNNAVSGAVNNIIR
jgi:hypothetical protein